MVCTRQSRRRRRGQRYFLTFQWKQWHSLPCYNQAFYFSSYLMRQTQGMHEITRPFFTVALHIPTPSTTQVTHRPAGGLEWGWTVSISALRLPQCHLLIHGFPISEME